MSAATPYSEKELDHRREISELASAQDRGPIIEWDRWLATVDALQAEIERLSDALHDAEAIGDFATELRDRMSLKENAEACAKMAAEATEDRDAANAKLAEIQAVVNEQTEDEGLWFDAVTAPEGYLQQALRRLHAAVEGKKP